MKNLEKGDNTEVNGIWGIINPKGVDTFALDLEEKTLKLYNIIFEEV